MRARGWDDACRLVTHLSVMSNTSKVPWKETETVAGRMQFVKNWLAGTVAAMGA